MLKNNFVVIKTIIHILKGIVPGVSLLFIHAIIVSIFRADPYLATEIYQQRIFKFFRKGFDNTLGLLDLPLIYLILPLVLILLLSDLISRKTSPKFLNKIIYLFNYMAAFVLLFYVFWGYNYYTVGLEQRMGFDTHELKLDEAYIIEKLNTLAPVINLQRDAITDQQIEDISAINIENRVRPTLQKSLEQYAYDTESIARVKGVLPGVLMRFRTSGIYIPYVFEGHFDKSIHKIQWPFTIAHEMAHAYAVTDEKECNFAAFIACTLSEDKLLNYSGAISYWRYLAFALMRTNQDEYKLIRKKLSNRVQKDLNEINDAISKYPELMPKSRDKIYDRYLKSHGIAEGIQSYDKMIEMVELWSLFNQSYE